MCRLLKTASTLALALGWLTTAAAMAQHAELTTAKLPTNSDVLGPGDGFFPLADLTVPEFRATAAVRLTSDGYFTLPVRFTVTNQGQRAAGAFKLAVYVYDNRPPARLVKFTTATPGQKPGWYAWSRPLEAGDQQTFVGRISLSRALAGTTVILYVHADSTAGEELANENGRVGETIEKNNYSKSIRVRLPRVIGGQATTSFRRK